MKVTIKGLRHISAVVVAKVIAANSVGDIIAYGVADQFLHMKNHSADASREAIYVDSLIRAMLVSGKGFGVHFQDRINLATTPDNMLYELENLEGVNYIYITIEEA